MIHCAGSSPITISLNLNETRSERELRLTKRELLPNSRKIALKSVAYKKYVSVDSGGTIKNISKWKNL